MIAFNNSRGGKRNNEDSKDKLTKQLQKLLDIIHNDPEFYPGSHHESIDISFAVQAIYQILFAENNKSLHLILDRQDNDSLDMTIDKIE